MLPESSPSSCVGESAVSERSRVLMIADDDIEFESESEINPWLFRITEVRMIHNSQSCIYQSG